MWYQSDEYCTANTDLKTEISNPCSDKKFRVSVGFQAIKRLYPVGVIISRKQDGRRSKYTGHRATFFEDDQLIFRSL